MTARIVPFELEHLNTFTPESAIPGIYEICKFNLANRQFRTLGSVFVGNECIALCGTHAINKDCLEVFQIPGVNIKKHGKAVVWAMKTMTDILIKDRDRLQMPVLEKNRKWAEVLGFKFEGIVEKYLDGKDHYMYVKVRA